MHTHPSHHWKFFRVGGVEQVAFRTGQDIVNLEHLDQKLWVALACPTKLVEFDERTLALMDADNDGRIRAPEVVQITRWVKEVFRNPDDLMRGGDSVPLASINDANPAGAAVLGGAKRVLSNLGKAEATAITLGDVSDTAKIFASTNFNGDGIVPADCASDDATKKFIEEIISTQGSVTDRSGKPGINQAKLEAYKAEAAALLAWQAKADGDKSVAALGDLAATGAALDAVKAVRAKVDDYFARCRVAEFDSRAAGHMNRQESDLATLATKELTVGTEEIVRLPLARVEPGRALPLGTGVNPAWSGAVAGLAAKAVTPILGPGKTSLTEADWAALQAKLAPFEAWSGAKPAAAAEKAGLARLREFTNAGAAEKIAALIKKDADLAAENDQIIALEKLVRLQRDLLRFLNNFVSFSDFYSRRGAIFQAGTLYLDQRSCDLCVHVADGGKHAALAGLAKAYLAYCDCTRPGGQKMTIAAAFTAGDSDHLLVGRNGVFYDRKGQDWDATIVKIIDNPISIRQAFFSPYKKFVRMMEEQVAKRASAAEAASQAKLDATAAGVANADKTKPAAAPEPKKFDVGMIAAMGVALGSLGTFLGLMFGKFVDLGTWAPVALLALIIAISGPSMLIAWLKLRQRNLGPILDANGWAVNGRMKINVPFGGALSKMPTLPAGSEVQVSDPFGESHGGRNVFYAIIAILIGLLIAWKVGFLNQVLPENLRTKPAAPKAAAWIAPAGTADFRVL